MCDAGGVIFVLVGHGEEQSCRIRITLVSGLEKRLALSRDTSALERTEDPLLCRKKEARLAK